MAGSASGPSTCPLAVPFQEAAPSTPAKGAAAAHVAAPLCPCCHNFLCSPRPRTPLRRRSGAAELSSLPDDALEMVAAKVGSDLGRFACVSRGMNEVAKPAIWRKAYQAKFFEEVEDEWGTEALPDSLWRACMLRQSGPKPMQ